MKKGLILVLAMVMVVCISISATLAYLFVDTTPVENTFEYGDINITLDESKDLDLKMIPGKDITKDPKVTVLKNSEACWLFVMIEKSTNFDNFMEYTVATGWTQGDGTNVPANVYYREVPAMTANTEFEVLDGNKVHVKEGVLKTALNAFDTDKNGELSEGEKAALPKLTFTAYAVQKDNVTSVADAWELVGTEGVPANS
jgi:hypothetical protein